MNMMIMFRRIIIICLMTYLFIENSSCTQCNIFESDRADCHPENGASMESCVSRGCCWRSANNPYPGSINVPWCYFPSDYNGYNVTAIKHYKSNTTVLLRRQLNSGFKNDVTDVKVELISLNNHLVRIRISDAKKPRFEPQLPKLNIPAPSNLDGKLYDIQIDPTGKLNINRKSTNKSVFSTNLKNLIFSDQFHQLSSKLPSKYIYGLGEHKEMLRKEANGFKRYTLFNRDQYPIFNSALYGSHPFYMTLDDEDQGLSSGVLLFNSNPMDIILTPKPSIMWRPIGGILDFYVILDETPSGLTSNYINLIGLPVMPPLWSLGFHLCKYGYGTLNETVKVWNRTRNAKIPFDVQWNDIDYMKDRNDFTYDEKKFYDLPKFVNYLHKLGMRYIVILDPGVSAGEKPGTYPPYDDGLAMDIFIKNASNKILVGKVWNKSGRTVFPDFTNPRSEDYWTKQVKDFHDKVKFDGLWIDMNEISNFVDGSLDGCPNNDYENTQYVPGNRKMQEKGLCLSAKQYAGLQYDVHNLYSTYETKVTNIALKKVIPNERPFIVSRSSFVGLGHYGNHWSGDVASTWEDLRYSIPSILSFNMFGVPFIGADICGFNGNTTVELCARWSTLGAFYPFSRNHNSDECIDQDPVAMGPTVVSAAKNALEIRYILLPYLYTLFYKAHVFGELVARPLFFVFPKDKTSRSIETQFLWGSGLMIAPVLNEKSLSVNVYLPKGVWYDFSSFEPINSTGKYYQYFCDLDRIKLFIRGGEIITYSDPILLTNQLRKSNFNIIVALDENKTASGQLYWDDGVSLSSLDKGNYNLLNFRVKNQLLAFEVVKNGYLEEKYLSTIMILGIDKQPDKVTLNNENINFSYMQQNKWLLLTLPSKTSIYTNLTLAWK